MTRPESTTQKRKKCLLPVAACFSFSLFFLSSMETCGAAAGSRQKLVQAVMSQKTDALGFRWDVQSDGRINDGSNDCFDGGLRLQINGQRFNCARPMMTQDGGEFVLQGNAGPFQVIRRVKIDTQASNARYVEMITNNGRQKATAALNIHSNLGGSPQQTVSDAGAQNPSALGKKESGVIALQRASYQRPSVVFFLADSKSKVKPAVQTRGDDCYFTYSLDIPPGKTVSIIHGVMQRNLTAVPNEKEMKKLFAPFNAKQWLKDLPSEVRKTLANKRRGYGSFLVPGLSFDLREIRMDNLNTDLLVLGQETQLRGTCSCASISVEGIYGKVEIPFARIVAVTGAKSQNGETAVLLRDGQIIKGKIAAEEFRFAMPSGLSVSLDIDKLDRLVMRSGPDDFKPATGTSALVETYEGDRLAVLTGPDAAAPAENGKPPATVLLSARTLWGNLDIPLSDIIYVKPLMEDMPGHRVLLKNGSNFSVFLSKGALSLNTEFFGAQKVEVPGIRAIHASHLVSAEGEDLEDITEPYLVLAGENVVISRIDLSQVTFTTMGENIPVPPDQIRELHNTTLEDDESAGVNALFTAQIWGGGTVTGYLKERILPIRVGESVWHVPVRDLAHAFVPTPFVAESLRKRIAELIRLLGHSSWEKREEANRELKELGHMAKNQLQEARDRISDPEVKRRVRFLLEELEE